MGGKGEAKPGLRGLQLRKAWLSGPFCLLHLGPRHFRQTGESRVSLLAGAISGALRLRGGSPRRRPQPVLGRQARLLRGRGVVRGRAVGVPWAWLPSRLCPPTPQQLPPPPAARTEGAVLPPPARPGACEPGLRWARMSGFLEELLGEKLVTGGGEEVDVHSLAARGISLLGLYFGCSLSAPCAQLSASLAAFYGRLRGDAAAGPGPGPGAGASAEPEPRRRLEIVFVSSDQDQRQWQDFVRDMPWLALPYKEKHRKVSGAGLVARSRELVLAAPGAPAAPSCSARASSAAPQRPLPLPAPRPGTLLDRGSRGGNSVSMPGRARWGSLKPLGPRDPDSCPGESRAGSPHVGSLP